MFTDIVKLGKKGQITLPKEIREDEGYREGDEFKLTHMPGGDVLLQKRNGQSPLD
ncbi:AbrB/MazE/SpoVT family DNA-binding domain-containing protein [Candidatus Micrarchaeota archaeon]|nr:AbrB/MazE/SpoVT family DNA-binding domain-containing protein [Candidatus Micrarchaeota archaeon]